MVFFFLSSRRRHTRCALVTGVQTCALPISGTGSQSQTSRIEETVNYEITKTVKTHIREAGMVRRLSVAVMVNGDETTDAAGNPTYEPRSVEEMEKITRLVRSAVGYDESRRDTIEENRRAACREEGCHDV